MKVEDFDTPKHAEFVANFFKLNMNATRAYKATYGQELDDNTAAANASRLLTNAKVSEAVHKRIKANIMEADELLFRVSEFARSEHGQYLKTDGTVDVAKLVEDGKAHLVKGIRETKYGRAYDFHDPKQYLELQGKYLALWKERIEIDSAYQREILQLLKNGDVTQKQAMEVLGETEFRRLYQGSFEDVDSE